MTEAQLTKYLKRGASALTILIVGAIVLTKFLGHNNDQDFQVRQSIGGNIEIQDRGGYYGHFFNTIWTYPRTIQEFYSASEKEGGSEDESIRVTFNDGGTAQVSTMVRFRLPASPEKRILLHRDFGGSVDAISHAVRSHLINSAKATAPLMSASENQSARKAEFTELIGTQLRVGLYRMKKVEKVLKDKTDTNGKPITVFATEIITDSNGQPLIAEESPLKKYNLDVLQFSVTSIDYDSQTLKAFAVKKDAFLKAESMKSERESEVQQRLMIVERGLREKAEVEAKALKEKAQAVINAEREKEVAELQAAKKVAIEKQAKLEAETKARKLLEVAKINKNQAETLATQKLEVAKLNALAAAKDAEAIRILAKAEEERIIKAGAVTERDRVLAQIAADRDAKIAAEISKIKVPQFVISGGNSGSTKGEGTDLTNTLMNLFMLDKLSVTDNVKQPISSTVKEAMNKQ